MARKSKLNAGIIGLGIIGSRIAENLRKAGYQVFVWNRTPKPAPNFLASPAEVAGICDVVQIVVADSAALFAILEAMSGVLAARHTIICSATIGARATLEAARMVEATGAKFLDAPFTGSKGAAEKGELVYYIGGTGDAFRNAEAVLKASSKAIVKIGAAGEAATVKIATNMIAAVTVQTLVEACSLLAKSGMDPAVLIKALEHHGARSGLSDMKLPKIVTGDHETHFSVKHMFKDVQLAIQDANRWDIDLPATTATAGSLYNAISQGWADLDFSSIAKFYDLRKPEAPAPPPVAVPEPPVPALAEAAEPQPPVPALVSQELPPVVVPPSGIESLATTPIEIAAPEALAAAKPEEIPPPSSAMPAEPVKKEAEPVDANSAPVSAESLPPDGVEKTPEPVLPPIEKPKRPPSTTRVPGAVARWFRSGRKAL